jgi:hypothetical protein
MPQIDNSGPIITFSNRNRRHEPHEQPTLAGDHYCRQRERQERAAAKSAKSAAVRRVHQELAQLYAQVLRQTADDK